MYRDIGIAYKLRATVYSEAVNFTYWIYILFCTIIKTLFDIASFPQVAYLNPWNAQAVSEIDC